MREALPPPRRQPVPATTVAPVAPVAGACFTGTGSYRQFQSAKASQPVYPGQAASLLIAKRQSSGYSSRGATLSSTNYSYSYKKSNSGGDSNRPVGVLLLGSACCRIRWSEAGRIYLLIGGIICGLGIVTLLATVFGHHGPVWIGPVIVCAGLILASKGVFDYVRYRVKASAAQPDPVENTSERDTIDNGAKRQRRRMRLVSSLPFSAASARRRRRKQLAANLRYIHGTGVSGASNTASWAAGYSREGTLLQPPPTELVQNASLLLAGSGRARQADGSGLLFTGGSVTSSGSFGMPREPVYFPVMSSTSRLPTPQETPFPSVFSLQDNGGGAAVADARGRLLSTRRSSGMSAPSLFDTLRASSSRQAVVGRSRTRFPLMPSHAAARLTSHKEEV